MIARMLWSLGILVSCCASLYAQQVDQAASAVDLQKAGTPLAEARRKAIHALPFHRPLSDEKLTQWLEISSRCTMAEFELFLAPLTPQEQKLLEVIESKPAPIVNRLHFEDLRGVLKQKALVSLRIEQQREHDRLSHTTPAVENLLYGAFDAVFASVGPPHGSPRYGDVIIHLKDAVREKGWATPFSGMHFMYAIRHKDARKMQDLLADGKKLPTSPYNPLSLGFNDRLHFANYVVTEQYWNRALAYQAILVLRNLDDSPASQKVRSRFSQMLTEKDPQKFWSLFIPPRVKQGTEEEEAAEIPFGYLEGKFDDQLSIQFFESIEVAADKLNEVRSWPEAQPFLSLIKAKAPGTP
ncbi:hypothetical protein Enr10x_32320 [Gimesia panareensis]|uniref:Uncharacterized protein n=1 Tax=Gimesia panareensis TaxID=2527978 RepID=A0A517Q8F6_9PLAN|nr:hypothetical protein [Gimesia panareensis]QDT27896.1 hypothetical protein Enr10x_32320 [Gimesia panareensis]